MIGAVEGHNTLRWNKWNDEKKKGGRKKSRKLTQDTHASNSKILFRAHSSQFRSTAVAHELNKL